MVAFVGAVVIGVACILPYANITDNSVSPPSPSIFNPGCPAGLWFAVEPMVVILVAIAAGVMLISVRGRIPRALAAGALLAFGVQTVVLFAGYVGASAGTPSEHAAIGGVVGVIGGLAILAAGSIAAASLGVPTQPQST